MTSAASRNALALRSMSFTISSKRRQEHWPHAMNTTATHDTKRGEDARARINVLSELPDEWEGMP